MQHFFALSFPFFPPHLTPNLRSLLYNNLVLWPLHDFQICSLWPHLVCILSAKSCIVFLVKHGKPIKHDGPQSIYTDSKLLFPFLLFWSCHEHVWAFLGKSHRDSGNTVSSQSGLVRTVSGRSEAISDACLVF